MVQDELSNVSSCAMDIEVGALQDPKDIPGLTKLVSNMITKGTEKYPDPSDTDSLLEKNKGFRELTTLPSSTKYYFELKGEGFLSIIFEEALDRFALQFRQPLFHRSYLDETKAMIVKEGVGLDTVENRTEQILRKMANSRSEFSK